MNESPSRIPSFSKENLMPNNAREFASFGAIHLKITRLEKAILFWTKIVGMKLRVSSTTMAEFGTETQTLVVVHETAKRSFKKGYSGLYHFAIHAPNKEEFARMAQRLIDQNYPFSPVDHVMSKSIYLDDPDGINIEFTLETPERFKRMATEEGLKIEDSEGNIRNASSYLDIPEVLKNLNSKDAHKIISNETYIGHIHLYANTVQNTSKFYQKIGFIPFNELPEFMYTDLAAGGAYQHRIALNSWHGIHKDMAPDDHAGMIHFQLVYNSKEKLLQVLSTHKNYEETAAGYYCFDPTGNKVLLTH